MHVVGGFDARVESWPLLTHLGSRQPPEVSLKKKRFYLSTYFWLCWVFVAARAFL